MAPKQSHRTTANLTPARRVAQAHFAKRGTKHSLGSRALLSRPRFSEGLQGALQQRKALLWGLRLTVAMQPRRYNSSRKTTDLSLKKSVLPELAEELLVCAHDLYGHFQVFSMLAFPFKKK